MTPGMMKCGADSGCCVQMQPTQNAKNVTETPQAAAETEQPQLKTAGVGGSWFTKRNLPGAGFLF